MKIKKLLWEGYFLIAGGFSLIPALWFFVAKDSASIFEIILAVLVTVYGLSVSLEHVYKAYKIIEKQDLLIEAYKEILKNHTTRPDNK